LEGKNVDKKQRLSDILKRVKKDEPAPNSFAAILKSLYTAQDVITIHFTIVDKRSSQVPQQCETENRQKKVNLKSIEQIGMKKVKDCRIWAREIREGVRIDVSLNPMINYTLEVLKVMHFLTLNPLPFSYKYMSKVLGILHS
jgi:hypothetical protein